MVRVEFQAGAEDKRRYSAGHLHRFQKRLPQPI